jgi:hypothetical protein
MPDHPKPCSICRASAVCLSITGWADPISAGDFFLTRCLKCARTFACRYVGVPDGASFPKPRPWTQEQIPDDCPRMLEKKQISGIYCYECESDTKPAGINFHPRLQEL